MNRTCLWNSVTRRRLAVLGGAVLVAACAGIEVATAPGGTTITGTVPGSGGTGGGSATSPGGSALVGRWTRIVLIGADDGSLHESRTLWEFRPDGSAIRTVTAWNLSTGFYDTLVTVARWSTSGSVLTLTWIAPAGGATAFVYRLEPDRLVIGPDEYARAR